MMVDLFDGRSLDRSMLRNFFLRNLGGPLLLFWWSWGSRFHERFRNSPWRNSGDFSTSTPFDGLSNRWTGGFRFATSGDWDSKIWSAVAFLFFFSFGPAGAPPMTVLSVGGCFKWAARADWEKMVLNSISMICPLAYSISSRTWTPSLLFKIGSFCLEDERRQASHGTFGSTITSVARNSQLPWAKKNFSFQCLLLEYPDRMMNLVFWQPWKLKVYSDFGFLNGLYIFRNS